jgi:hypothetical protein
MAMTKLHVVLLQLIELSAVNASKQARLTAKSSRRGLGSKDLGSRPTLSNTYAHCMCHTSRPTLPHALAPHVHHMRRKIHAHTV